MKKYIIAILSALILSVFAFQSCGDEPNVASFDRKAFLEHQAKNIIVPNINTYSISLGILESNWNNYKKNPSETNLATLRDQWKSTYLDWESVCMYNFGPGSIDGLRRSFLEEVGTYPVDATLIAERVQAEDFDMSNYKRDARGMLALDYLFFSEDTDLTESKTQQYVEAVLGKIIQRTTTIKNTWRESYLTEFINNTDTNVKGATSLLYNDWLKSFEWIKNLKIATPMGLIAGQTAAKPELAEAYYSGYSIEGAKANFDAIVNIWYGKTSDGTDGLGFKEYLESVEGGKNIVVSSEEKIQAVYQAFEALPAGVPLRDLATQENEKAKILKDKLQDLTRFFKSDMSSVLGIAITFDNSDGD